MKWYLRPVTIIIAILAVGPFAIPLVWLSPAFKKWLKVTLTVLLILLSIVLVKCSMQAYSLLLKEMQALQAVLR